MIETADRNGTVCDENAEAVVTKTQRQWLTDHGLTLPHGSGQRFASIWRQAHERYAEDHIREAVLLAAAHYLEGGADLRALGDDLAAARARVDEQLAVARIVATLAISDGRSENATAKELGVDRMAVRDWLGKR